MIILMISPQYCTSPFNNYELYSIFVTQSLVIHVVNDHNALHSVLELGVSYNGKRRKPFFF